jgi:hypothetical protein
MKNTNNKYLKISNLRYNISEEKKMKNKWQFFLFLMLFALADGFGQQQAADSEIIERLDILEDNIETIKYFLTGEEAPQRGIPVPFSIEIAKTVMEDSDKNTLNNIFYYLSSSLTITTLPEREVKNNDNGRLIIDNGSLIKQVTITKTSKGKLANKIDEFIVYERNSKEEILLVKFDESDSELIFIRNNQTRRFDYYGVYGLYSEITGQRPYLCVYVDRLGVINQSDRPVQQGSQSSYSASDTVQFPGSIEEGGTLQRDVIVSYIISRGSSMDRERIGVIVDAYIREAEIERINHDIAIAQMCYATSFLNNENLIKTHNYGGFNTDAGISIKYGGSHGSIEEGVRAHIQHLKGYASRETPVDLVDNRYRYLVTSGILGTVKYFDDLFFATWAPGNSQNYKYEIRRILGDMYRLSGRFS